MCALLLLLSFINPFQSIWSIFFLFFFILFFLLLFCHTLFSFALSLSYYFDKMYILCWNVVAAPSTHSPPSPTTLLLMLLKMCIYINCRYIRFYAWIVIEICFVFKVSCCCWLLAQRLRHTAFEEFWFFWCHFNFPSFFFFSLLLLLYWFISFCVCVFLFFLLFFFAFAFASLVGIWFLVAADVVAATTITINFQLPVRAAPTPSHAIQFMKHDECFLICTQ